MDFQKKLQGRSSSSSSSSSSASASASSSSSHSYIPPHRTQLHPRMISSLHSHHTTPNSKRSHPHQSLIFLFLCLFLTTPFLYYHFSSALKIHSSPIFSSPNPSFFALLLHASPSSSRISLFHFLGRGPLPFLSSTASAHAKPGFASFRSDPDAFRGSVVELVEFAKGRVPRKEWGNTRVQLMAAQDLEGLGEEAREEVLECCRQVLRLSGFLFKDQWARVITGDEQCISSWVAVNYALGNLGREPQETTGIVELGGASLQVTSALLNAKLVQSSQTIRLSGVTYNLYTRNWPHLGQDMLWKSLEEQLKYRELKLFSNSSKGNLVNPCIPRGYEYPWISNASYVKFQPAGNFLTCKSEALSLLKKTEDRCLHRPCKITSSIYELSAEHVSSRGFSYTSEILRMAPGTSLFELEAAGQHYCEDHWDALKDKHDEIDYLDLLKYCFSSAYMVALLHDVLRIPMEEKRIGFGNQKLNNNHIDWTLGSFIIETMAEPLEMVEHIDDAGMVVGNESVAYFSLFALLLLIVLAAFFVLQWRKPQLKTVYDLEKGHYIVTRVPR